MTFTRADLYTSDCIYKSGEALETCLKFTTVRNRFKVLQGDFFFCK